MQDAIYIAGPTASGKSAIALDLAGHIGGEIISVDSMQVYRGMDIGAAKPSAGERGRVRHHLLDVAEITDPFDAARFVALARAAEAEIRSRGKIPIFCGGTGLYFNALIGGLTESKPAPELRTELERTPLAQLLSELHDKDPAAFARIDRQNPRRVIRAVEMARTGETKRPWSKTQTGHWFGVEWSRPVLNERIEARVEQMFRTGLISETQQLLDHGLQRNRTALQAIGYRQVVEHLLGERDLPSTIAHVKQKTRQYAKRQVTWFRRQLDINWIPGGETNLVASQIASRLAR